MLRGQYSPGAGVAELGGGSAAKWGRADVLVFDSLGEQRATEWTFKTTLGIVCRVVPVLVGIARLW